MLKKMCSYRSTLSKITDSNVKQKSNLNPNKKYIFFSHKSMKVAEPSTCEGGKRTRKLTVQKNNYYQQTELVKHQNIEK